MKKHFAVLWSIAFSGLFACTTPVPDDGVPGSLDEVAEEDIGASSAELSSSRAAEWFPMSEGDSWTLTNKNKTQTIRIEYAEDGIRLATGINGDEDLWLGYAPRSPNSLYAFNFDADQWEPFIRFGYRYTPWAFSFNDSGCGKFHARRTATDIQVSTPAGLFKDARTIEFTQVPAPHVRCVAPAFSHITFAHNVGPIAIVNGMGETFLLKSAKVGNRSYPVAQTAAVKATVSSDRAVYVNQPNTIRCITTPCPGNEVTAVARFALTVTNTSTTAQQFQFSSGKQFDFEILNAQGKVVKAWSDDRMFTMALSQFSLQPGASRTFRGEVSLKDRDGLQLNGHYTVRGKLTVRDGINAAQAISSFRVDVRSQN